MQFNTQRGQGATSYLQNSMVPTMVNASQYWNPDQTINAHTQAQGLLDRTELKSIGQTLGTMATNDAVVYEADTLGRSEYNTQRAESQTRFATDILGGVTGFATGMANLGGGFSNNNDPGTFGTSFGVGQTNYSYDAPASQYAPGSISSPGWTWANSGIG